MKWKRKRAQKRQRDRRWAIKKKKYNEEWPSSKNFPTPNSSTSPWSLPTPPQKAISFTSPPSYPQPLPPKSAPTSKKPSTPFPASKIKTQCGYPGSILNSSLAIWQAQLKKQFKPMWDIWFTSELWRYWVSSRIGPWQFSSEKRLWKNSIEKPKHT